MIERLDHPFPNMGEPEKASCHLTDYREYDEGHLARDNNDKAGLHSIDCFFRQVRERFSILTTDCSASSSGRTWYGYGAYTPESIVKRPGIFRACYNFSLARQDGKMPVMGLGLSRAQGVAG